LNSLSNATGDTRHYWNNIVRFIRTFDRVFFELGGVGFFELGGVGFFGFCSYIAKAQ
jgi:hypothetical protein